MAILIRIIELEKRKIAGKCEICHGSGEWEITKEDETGIHSVWRCTQCKNDFFQYARSHGFTIPPQAMTDDERMEDLGYI